MKKGLNAATLKTIAIIAMVIDHISWGFFDFYSPQGYLLHIIGRFTIPIMCFFVAEGFRKTHDRKRYILRMTVFAAISVVPFYLFFHEEYAYRQNIIFDYLLALLLLAVLESRIKKPAKAALAALLFIVSAVIGGWPIIPMAYILIFYYKDTFRKQAIWFCTVTVGLVLFMMLAITLNSQFNFYPMYNEWVWWDKSYFLGFMFALPLLKMYNGEKGSYPCGRYFFFVFYPAHLLVLYLAQNVIKNFGSFWLYVGLQLLCIVIVGWLIIRITLEKSSKAQNASIIFSISGLVYVIAFFLETTASTKELAYGAVTMEYLGEAGAFLGLTMFVSEFCHVRIKRWFYIIEGIILGSAVVLVNTAESNHIFYTSVDIDFSGEFPRLVLGYGFGFIGFYVFLVVLCVLGTVMLLKAVKKASEIERKRIWTLLLAMCFPWLAVIIRSLGLTGGYEVSFLGVILASIFSIIALIKYGYFDSVQEAVTNVIYKSSEGLLVVDNNRYVLYYNSIVKDIFPDISENSQINSIASMKEVIGRCFGESGSPNIHESNGRVYEIKAEPILEAEYVQGFMIRISDYTEHYRSIEKLRESAHIDALTGLYDREYFKQAIIDDLAGGRSGALFMLDVDFFKSINDNFGHIIGDEALITLAKSLREVFADRHLYCRVGGDEFMVFVRDTDYGSVTVFAENLNAVYQSEIIKVADGLTSSLSIGIALSSSLDGTAASGEAFEALYGLADKALYQTKENGRNGFSFYENMAVK